MAILKKKLVERGGSMSEEILNYIATNVCTNVRDLESSLTKLIAYSELLGQEISFDKAKELLGILPSLAANSNQTLSIDTIIKVVGEYFNVSSFEIKGKKEKINLSYNRGRLPCSWLGILPNTLQRKLVLNLVAGTTRQSCMHMTGLSP